MINNIGSTAKWVLAKKRDKFLSICSGGRRLLREQHELKIQFCRGIGKI